MLLKIFSFQKRDKAPTYHTKEVAILVQFKENIWKWKYIINKFDFQSRTSFFVGGGSI